MMTISVIGRSTAEHLMFVLELAKTCQLTGKTTAMVNHTIYQDLLFEYPFHLLAVSGIDLLDSLEDAAGYDVVVHNGHCDVAQVYVVVLSHNLFSIKSTQAYLQAVDIATCQLVLLNALDIKQDIDYIEQSYLQSITSCDDKYAIFADERDDERHFISQLNGEIGVKKMSATRRKALVQLVSNALALDANQQKNLDKEMKRG